MKKTPRSECPIEFCVSAFGDRWSLLIIRDLVVFNKRHFHELSDSAEQISTNMLADRLRRLEELGLVTRSPDPDNGRKTLYAPTEKCLDIAPILVEMMLWAGKYDENTPMSKALLKRIKRDRDGFATEMKEPGDISSD